MALLPDEPEGRISTCAAGIVEITAELGWRSGSLPPRPLLTDIPNNGRTRCSFVEVDDEDAASRSITGEILAFTEPDLRRTLGEILRSIGVIATLTEAVLEMRATRLASPAVMPADLLDALARDLLRGGFPVKFGRSWNPAPGADISVGVGGAGSGMSEYLGAHPGWEILPNEGDPDESWAAGVAESTEASLGQR